MHAEVLFAGQFTKIQLFTIQSLNLAIEIFKKILRGTYVFIFQSTAKASKKPKKKRALNNELRAKSNILASSSLNRFIKMVIACKYGFRFCLGINSNSLFL